MINVKNLNSCSEGATSSESGHQVDLLESPWTTHCQVLVMSFLHSQVNWLLEFTISSLSSGETKITTAYLSKKSQEPVITPINNRRQHNPSLPGGVDQLGVVVVISSSSSCFRLFLHVAPWHFFCSLVCKSQVTSGSSSLMFLASALTCLLP